MIQDLTDEEIERLDQFLMSDRSTENGMQLSDLDGFLTGIVSSPSPLLPSKWLPRIWGEGSPEFASTDEAQDIIGLIMRRYNFLNFALGSLPDAFEPIFLENPEGDPIAMDWAEGYLDAVKLDQAAWGPLFESNRGKKLLEPIASFWDGPLGREVFNLPLNEQIRIFKKAAPKVRKAAILVFRFWRQTGN